LATGQKQKASIVSRDLRKRNLNLGTLKSDQSRGPSAIDAPSHHGFGLYSHFEQI